jgi:glycosyltransferase involved in cell wall biosynthesis
MDIWPDAIKTNVSDNLYLKLYPILNGITEWTYRNSDKILITSKGFKDLICRYHNYSDKIIYFPNWSLDMSTEDIKLECPILPDGFKIMLAGNIGESQDLEAIGKCMILLKKYSNVKWIFIGDGSKKKWLESFVKENCLTETSVILGSYPISYMPNFYKMADAMLVTLKSGYFDLEMTVPARLQSYMSAGKPILAMIGKGAADLIRDSNCGYAVPSSNYEALADIIINKILPNREAFINKGKNGRLCYEKEFSLDVCIDHLENILQQKKQ